MKQYHVRQLMNAKNERSNRFAGEEQAGMLFRQVEWIRDSTRPGISLSFQGGVFYSVDFFVELIRCIVLAEESDWWGLLLERSDLSRDPVLAALCDEALETA